jgi:hypothetical protein
MGNSPLVADAFEPEWIEDEFGRVQIASTHQ